MHIKRFLFFTDKKQISPYLLRLLHQQVDVVFLLFQRLSQNVHLPLILKQFPLKTMVVLLQGLTNSLNSGQMSKCHIKSLSPQNHQQLKWTYPRFLHVKQAPLGTPAQEPLHRVTEDRIRSMFVSTRGWNSVLYVQTHLFLISLSDNNFCRKDCSLTCSSPGDELSSLPLNQRRGVRSRSKLGNSSFNFRKGKGRLDDSGNFPTLQSNTYSLCSQS